MGWESIKPEQRAGLIAAAIVLFLFPFWLPRSFLMNLVVSVGVAAVAFCVVWVVARRRYRNGGIHTSSNRETDSVLSPWLALPRTKVYVGSATLGS